VPEGDGEMRVRLRPVASCLMPLLLAACIGELEPGSVAPADIPDPTASARTGRPNDWLICPAEACAAEASATAPSFPAAPGELLAAWRAVLAAQPRATVIAVDEPRGLVMAQDRTPVLRFVDTVTVRVLPAGDGGSTFAAYSRSEIGYGDLGTNRRRLDAWSAEVGRELEAAP
jgi:uncharacterized protein (DUF1499 family)